MDDVDVNPEEKEEASAPEDSSEDDGERDEETSERRSLRERVSSISTAKTLAAEALSREENAEVDKG